MGFDWVSEANMVWLRRVLFERFGQNFSLGILNKSALWISHDSMERRIEFVSGVAAFCGSGVDLPCTSWNVASDWIIPIEKKIPAPGVKNLPDRVIEPIVNGYRIHYDILGLTYWMLSRREEMDRSDIDAHGRFPAGSSHAYRHGYLERPIVDEWLCILSQVIARTWPSLELRSHKFSVLPSHDVDSPSMALFKPWPLLLRSMGGDLLRRYDFKSCVQSAFLKLSSNTSLHQKDPFNTFDWIMDQSESLGLISAFYFICGRTDTKRDAEYEVSHPAIRNLMRRIHARGHEIGLHPSYGSYREPGVILSEYSVLRRVAEEEGIDQMVWGGRMHYLRWRQPVTLRIWEKAGLSYDSTLTYADHAGFRCGTCFEYPAFDPEEQKALKLRIRPLIVMEGSVIGPKYMGLGVSEAALEKMLALKQKCRAVSGAFTLLWHNSSLRTPAAKKLYKAVLSE